MVVPVEAHGGAVGHHVVGHLHHFLGKGLIDAFHAEGLGCAADFHHLFVDEASGVGLRHQVLRLAAEGYGHAVEGHVPHGLAPSRRLVIDEVCLDVGGVQFGKQAVHHRRVGAGVVADVDGAVELVVDHAGLGLRRADEGEACCQGNAREHPLHVGLHADAVLDEHHEGGGLEQRRKEVAKQGVVVGLQPYEHHVARRHRARVLIDMGIRQMEVAQVGANLQPVLPDVFVVAVKQEVDFLSAPCQFRTVVAADGAGANHSVSHVSCVFFLQN